jgi:hypothetical protein
MIQRTSNLDSACVLALVQEKALESGRKASYRRYELSSDRTVHRLGAPWKFPPKPDKSVGLSVSDDRKATKAARPNSIDDMFRSLR